MSAFLKEKITDKIPEYILLLKINPVFEYTKWKVKDFNYAYLEITHKKETLYVEKLTLIIKQRPLGKAIHKYKIVWTKNLPSLTESELADLYTVIKGLNYNQNLVMIDVQKESGKNNLYPVISNDGLQMRTMKKDAPLYASLPFKHKKQTKSILVSIKNVGDNQEILEIKECEKFEFNNCFIDVLSLSTKKEEGNISSHNSWRISNEEDFHHRWGFYLDAHVPNKLIAYSGKDKNQNTIFTTIIKQGQKIYYIDEIHDMFYDENLEPGIHVGENFTWIEGYDEDIYLEADFRSANMNDIKYFDLNIHDIAEAVKTIDDDINDEDANQRANDIMEQIIAQK